MYSNGSTNIVNTGAIATGSINTVTTSILVDFNSGGSISNTKDTADISSFDFEDCNITDRREHGSKLKSIIEN